MQLDEGARPDDWYHATHVLLDGKSPIAIGVSSQA
jgi:hypothetical protein